MALASHLTLLGQSSLDAVDWRFQFGWLFYFRCGRSNTRVATLPKQVYLQMYAQTYTLTTSIVLTYQVLYSLYKFLARSATRLIFLFCTSTFKPCQNYNTYYWYRCHVQLTFQSHKVMLYWQTANAANAVKKMGNMLCHTNG